MFNTYLNRQTDTETHVQVFNNGMGVFPKRQGRRDFMTFLSWKHLPLMHSKDFLVLSGTWMLHIILTHPRAGSIGKGDTGRDREKRPATPSPALLSPRPPSKSRGPTDPVPSGCPQGPRPSRHGLLPLPHPHLSPSQVLTALAALVGSRAELLQKRKPTGI